MRGVGGPPVHVGMHSCRCSQAATDSAVGRGSTVGGGVTCVSAPTTSVDGTFELIDTNVIFKKWIPFAKKLCFVPDTNSPTNVNSYMVLIVTAYDHNTALESDICVKSVDLMSSFYYSDP